VYRECDRLNVGAVLQIADQRSTIDAFSVQTSNETISTIYFDSSTILLKKKQCIAVFALLA
jgi:hypothetical protein